MATAKLFTLGKAQAVRILARYRLNAKEVEITQHEGGLLLRPKPRTAADLFAEIRAKYGSIDIAGSGAQSGAGHRQLARVQASAGDPVRVVGLNTPAALARFLSGAQRVAVIQSDDDQSLADFAAIAENREEYAKEPVRKATRGPKASRHEFAVHAGRVVGRCRKQQLRH